MKKIMSKKTNRTFSFVCIGVFVLSLACIAFFVGAIIKQTFEKQELLAQQERLEEEYNRLLQIYDNVDENGYYNVYTDGEMIVYGNGSTVEFKN